jgi:hypothetical protein
VSCFCFLSVCLFVFLSFGPPFVFFFRGSQSCRLFPRLKRLTDARSDFYAVHFLPKYPNVPGSFQNPDSDACMRYWTLTRNRSANAAVRHNPLNRSITGAASSIGSMRTKIIEFMKECRWYETLQTIFRGQQFELEEVYGFQLL